MAGVQRMELCTRQKLWWNTCSAEAACPVASRSGGVVVPTASPQANNAAKGKERCGHTETDCGHRRVNVFPEVAAEDESRSGDQDDRGDSHRARLDQILGLRILVHARLFCREAADGNSPLCLHG
jgi:hypothetical protein